MLPPPGMVQSSLEPKLGSSYEPPMKLPAPPPPPPPPMKPGASYASSPPPPLKPGASYASSPPYLSFFLSGLGFFLFPPFFAAVAFCLGQFFTLMRQLAYPEMAQLDFSLRKLLSPLLYSSHRFASPGRYVKREQDAFFLHLTQHECEDFTRNTSIGEDPT